MSNVLEEFLLKEENSRTKEAILNYRIFYDLKLAAAARGYDLSLYTPDVDRDGFDIILDNKDSVRKIQLKTVLKSSITTRWPIHKTMLRPDDEFCEFLGFEPSQFGTGVHGGVILIEIEPAINFLHVEYYYTDIFVITALDIGIVTSKPRIRKSVFNTFYSKIRNGVSNEKIHVPKSLFVKAKSPEHLIALKGFNSRFDHTWWYHLLTVSESRLFGKVQEKPPAPLERLEEIIAQKLIELTEDLEVKK